MTSRPAWVLAWLAVLWVVPAWGCGAADGDAAGGETARDVRPSADTAAPVRPTAPTTIGSVLGGSEGEECIRGGTTRADVRSIMGEPDSVSFGVWLYGASQVAFGYGVVVEYRNVDGNLVLCP